MLELYELNLKANWLELNSLNYLSNNIGNLSFTAWFFAFAIMTNET